MKMVRFFPLNGLENLDTASLFCNSSSSLMLNEIFLFSKFISAIAASILSPGINLFGLASSTTYQLLDFFIKISKLLFSGETN